MAKIPFEPPYYPIVYVRGYAGNDAAVEDTVADPYMGFNLGATKLRQTWKGDIRRHYFESPLVRLMKDHGYRDVYQVGREMPETLAVRPQSVFVYRYYDQVSSQLGPGRRGEILDYAQGLSELIGTIRKRMCEDCEEDPESFRVYLVAHSMGGLVCRSFLQHPQGDPEGVRGTVDKVFTYATPHNGIDLEIIGNVPGFFTRNNADNFDRDRMRDYLDLRAATEKGDDRLDSLDGRFDPDRFFCLVGTNSRDYEVAGGWSRRVVGPMSDGLVRIRNATVWGTWGRGNEKRLKEAPRAFVHRSHSGHFGIVNSEDGYQNLTRFLFGTVRVDGVLEIFGLSLPADVQKARDEGKEIRASYHFEVVVRTRGARWDLHRRLVDEGSAIFRKFDDIFPRDGGAPRHPHLFSAFLADWGRVKDRRQSLGFAIDLGVQVPEYRIDERLWFDDFFEGGYLYRQKINLEALPPRGDLDWRLRYGIDRSTPNRATRAAEELADGGEVPVSREAGDLVFRIPVVQKTRPGIDARLVLRARPWS